jgi:hypothetical protein
MSKWKGAAGSNCQFAALAPDAPLKFKRMDCEGCAKETIFRGLKCLSCGVIKPLRVRKMYGNYVGQMAGVKTRDYRQQMVLDRIAAAKQKAAESRAKFEGKK